MDPETEQRIYNEIHADIEQKFTEERLKIEKHWKQLLDQRDNELSVLMESHEVIEARNEEQKEKIQLLVAELEEARRCLQEKSEKGEMKEMEPEVPEVPER